MTRAQWYDLAAAIVVANVVYIWIALRSILGQVTEIAKEWKRNREVMGYLFGTKEDDRWSWDSYPHITARLLLGLSDDVSACRRALLLEPRSVLTEPPEKSQSTS